MPIDHLQPPRRYAPPRLAIEQQQQMGHRCACACVRVCAPLRRSLSRVGGSRALNQGELHLLHFGTASQLAAHPRGKPACDLLMAPFHSRPQIRRHVRPRRPVSFTCAVRAANHGLVEASNPVICPLALANSSSLRAVIAGGGVAHLSISTCPPSVADRHEPAGSNRCLCAVAYMYCSRGPAASIGCDIGPCTAQPLVGLGRSVCRCRSQIR